MSEKPSFFSELKRRNVYKVAVAYIVAAWLLFQMRAGFSVLRYSELGDPARRVNPHLGFPVALVLSWAFEITPEGIKRESEVAHEQSKTRHTGRRVVGLTIIAGIIAAGLLVFQLWHSKLGPHASPSVDASFSTAARGIAVLPLVNTGGNTANNIFPTACLKN